MKIRTRTEKSLKKEIEKFFPDIEYIISDYKQYKVLRSILSYNVKQTNQTNVENYAFKCR